MAKKALIDSKLLETIDDQIYKHLPIDKLKVIVKDEISKAMTVAIEKISQELGIEHNRAKAIKLAQKVEKEIYDKPSNASRQNRLKA
jgi:hypothetical protein